jgi:tripartite-type tricarboxylate transporter receptor subunit TctC
MIHVPYRGSAPAVADLLAGNVDVMFDNLTSIWPQVQSGTLHALGVAGSTRTPLAPDLPAIAETLPGFEATTWVGIVGPAGTPPAVVDKISKAFGEAVQRPDLVKRQHELGATPAASTPAEFAAFIRTDRERWQRVAREANLSAN